MSRHFSVTFTNIIYQQYRRYSYTGCKKHESYDVSGLYLLCYWSEFKVQYQFGKLKEAQNVWRKRFSRFLINFTKNRQSVQNFYNMFVQMPFYAHVKRKPSQNVIFSREYYTFMSITTFDNIFGEFSTIKVFFRVAYRHWKLKHA